MADILDDLNDLLEKTRGSYEAVKSVADEIELSDPDIEDGLREIIEAERWSASGLYHRITQLDGTPTLRVVDLASRIAAIKGLDGRIDAIRRYQESMVRQVKSILSRHELDEATQSFLEEMRNLHTRGADWCKTVLKAWEPTEVPILYDDTES